MATPIDVAVFKCRKICPTGNRWDRALFTLQKNIFRPPRKLSLLGGLRVAPKIYKGQPATFGSQCSNFIEIGSLSAEL